MNKKFYYLLAFIVVSGFTNQFYAQLVSTNTALSNAITAAVPGSTIILADEVWNNTYINIKKTANAANPITIKAQTPGNVFMQGNSRVSMGGAYINLEGLIFKSPASLSTSGTTLKPVVEFQDSSSTSCSNCKVKNIKIESYNGTSSQSTYTFKWIVLYGKYNEISYSSFTGKNGVGSVINDNRDVVQTNYNRIHHNYFADRTFVGSYVDEYNDQDAIRIGNSNTSLSDSFTEVYDNLFSNWFGEIEVISNKSGSNKFYNNTFRNYSGSLTLRHGNNSEVYNNYFFANNNQFSGGIRVLGENHKIYNNYIEGVNSAKSTAAGGGNSTNLGGINLIAGKTSSVGGADLSGYYKVKNIIITNNTFVNGDFGIRLGGGSNTLAATGMVAANNIFLMPNSSAIAVDEMIPAILTDPYTFTKNIKQNGTWVLNGNLNNNQTVTSNLLTAGTDFYRIGASSAAINSAIGTYTFLTEDILKGNRPTLYDVGAEEFGAGGTKLPYKIADVGTLIGFLGTNAVLNTYENITITKGIKIYPNPTKGENINISAEQIIGKVVLYDSSGRLLMTKEIKSKTGQIEVSTLSKGVYILKILNTFGRFIVE